MDIGKFLKWFFEQDMIQATVVIILAITASWLMHRVIDVLFHYQRRIGRYKRSEDLQKRSRTLSRITKTALDIVIWIYAVILFLSEIGVDVAKMMTGAGLIGALIGFGAQNTIRDILAGFFIVLENQYRVGDIIEIQIAGRLMTGKVENMSLRITQIRDREGKLHSIRNGASEATTNMSFRYANVNFKVGVAYDTDIDHLEKVINEVGLKMAEDDRFAKIIIEPIRFVRISAFKESEIEINCLGRVKAGEQYSITGEFRRMLKKAFDQNGIEFPFPQVVVHDQASISKRISGYAAAGRLIAKAKNNPPAKRV
ncbi:MAG: mechanosensitive ion channel family protein [bacterium]|nr:mechanosensitive ion channel family protein [bacterium]